MAVNEWLGKFLSSHSTFDTMLRSLKVNFLISPVSKGRTSGFHLVGFLCGCLRNRHRQLLENKHGDRPTSLLWTSQTKSTTRRVNEKLTPVLTRVFNTHSQSGVHHEVGDRNGNARIYRDDRSSLHCNWDQRGHGDE